MNLQGPSPSESNPMASENPLPADPTQPPQNTSPLAGTFGLILSLALITTAGYLTFRAFTDPGDMKPDPANIICMCAETKQIFEHKPEIGENWPVMSPYTKRKTGYPVERCYWTKDNKQKSKPDYVILNEHLGLKGATLCPVCGRIVVGHNPPPPSNVPMADEPTSAPASVPKAKPAI